jgi:hypothetical protein
MNTEDRKPDEFELRTRALLRDSVDRLDGATRSRLTQARSAALAQRAPRRAWLDFRYLAPAGAVAAALLMSVLFIGRHDARDPVNESAGGALYDMELLADADAYELSQETDLEFIEWAAAVEEQDQAGG